MGSAAILDDGERASFSATLGRAMVAWTATSGISLASAFGMATRASIGISGWRYTPWRGEFYPPGLPQAGELRFAAERFPTIEVNGSFYSLQRPEYYERWRDEVPDDFVFAIKGSRYITHMLRLRGVETALANFFASGVLALEHKLGPLLWQLPPTLKLDRERLAKFLALLPRTTKEAAKLARCHDERVKGRAYLRATKDRALRHALEVRHPSFATPELVELLRARNIALVVADTAGRWPFLEDVTADFVYVRLHGDVKLYESGYTDAALDRWAARICAWRDGSEPPSAKLVAPPPRSAKPRDVYVYFDNDIKVHAPYDAMTLTAKVQDTKDEEDHDEGEPQPRPLSRQTRLRPHA